jgi:hypothetical protein
MEKTVHVAAQNKSRSCPLVVVGVFFFVFIKVQFCTPGPFGKLPASDQPPLASSPVARFWVEFKSGCHGG